MAASLAGRMFLVAVTLLLLSSMGGGAIFASPILLPAGPFRVRR
jgi:hypothetical protein